ncbi:unnamed protein product [Echinostoma caproni]|uniref:Uncharacterized protein n=1 Tax=Echinostoma caproni TaxID=27848 RepID=A0A183AYN3_9TREM|nr:unnamed protein product [Echinostoma caproni]
MALMQDRTSAASAEPNEFGCCEVLLTFVCDELFLAHIAPVDFNRYQFVIRFSGLSPESRLADDSEPANSPVVQLADVAFVFRYYNPQFTYMELISRFVFFILTELITSIFLFL